MGHLKSCVSMKIKTHVQQEAFALWAFGPKYNEFSDPMDFLEAWNELHSDELKLLEDSVMNTDILKMVDLWKSHSCNN